MDQPLGDKVMKDIKSDFVVQGTHRVHNWYAYAIIGIVMGMAVGIIYVANRNAQFDASKAAIIGLGDQSFPDNEDPYRLGRQAISPDRQVPSILATLQPGEVIKATQQDNGSIVFIGPDGQVLKLLSDGGEGAISREENNIIWVSTTNTAPAGGTPIKLIGLLKNGESMTIGLDLNNSNGGIVITPPRTSPNKPPVPVYGVVIVSQHWGTFQGADGQLSWGFGY